MGVVGQKEIGARTWKSQRLGSPHRFIHVERGASGMLRKIQFQNCNSRLLSAEEEGEKLRM